MDADGKAGMGKAGDELIVLENVEKTYHLDEVDVKPLRGVSVAIRRG